jgi:HEPN domain-containing protein
MIPAAKSLILKAQDSLDTAKRHLDNDEEHDIAGYNLAQASEHLLKALLVCRGLEFPKEDAHDLDVLMSVLEENGFPAVSSHADVVELNLYNSPSAHIRKHERLNLREMLQHVEDLKKLVGQHAM